MSVYALLLLFTVYMTFTFMIKNRRDKHLIIFYYLIYFLVAARTLVVYEDWKWIESGFAQYEDGWHNWI